MSLLLILILPLKVSEYVLPRYKIGDLGHVVAWNKEEACGEEGDCRYMAPEFLK